MRNGRGRSCALYVCAALIFGMSALVLRIAFSNENGQNAADVVIDVPVKIGSGDVYGLSVEYFVDGKAIGGQACSHDPMLTKPFERDEEILFQFTEYDFQNEELENGTFGLIFSVLQPGEESEVISVLWEWQAVKGEGYSFILTGSRERGYSVSAEFEAERTKLNDLPDGALS